MRYAHGLGALLVVLGFVPEAPAQFAVSGFGYSRSAWAGGFPGGPRVVGYSVSVGGFNGYPSGFGYPGGLGFYGPRSAYAFSSIPIAYPSLGVGTIGIGGNIGIGIATPTPITASQPIIIQQQAPPPQPIIIQQQAPAPQPIIIQQAAPAPNLVDPIVIRPRNQPDNAPAMPGAPAGGFRPLKPEDRPGARPPAKPEEKKPEKKKPEEEKNQPLLLGKQAFADREYGRALRFFKQATEADPKNALGFFLQAQAEFALGKYRDAVVSIHEGLRLEKDWPRSKFKPLEMYGPNAADFTDHMDQLQAALKRNPGDAVLLFLYGYELWFDGREDEARMLFLKARKLVAEPRFIDLFLAGKAADPVAAR